MPSDFVDQISQQCQLWLAKQSRSKARRWRVSSKQYAQIMELLEHRVMLTGVVTNTNDSGPGSLRQAILDANAATADTQITFNIPDTDPGYVDVDSSLTGGDSVPDVFRIQPLSALPGLNNVNGQTITIDGSTQHATTGDTNPFGPEIQLDGALAGLSASGLILQSDRIEISNLTISNFISRGITVFGSGTVISDSYLGTNPTGTIAAGNSEGIVVDGATDVQVGPNNVISGNIGQGLIALSGAADLEIVGNRIGTSADGTTAIGNTGAGIVLRDTTDITIGGETTDDRNIISGNGTNGIFASGSGVQDLTITSNYIGLNAAGDNAVPNGGNGDSQGIRLEMGVSNITIGRPGAGNVISGNLSRGIGDTFVENITIQSNIIGLDATGTFAIPNQGDGIAFSDARTALIGGEDPSERNIISGNRNSANNGNGISLRGTNLRVLGNYIGTDVTGSVDLGNVGTGISVNVIDTFDVADNLVSGNDRDGILIFGDATTTATVRDNQVGTTAAGTGSLGNRLQGIHLFEASNIDVTGNVSVASLQRSGVLLQRSEDIRVVENSLGVLSDGTTDAGNVNNGLQVSDSVRVTADQNVISANGGHGISLGSSSDIAITGNFIGTTADGSAPLGNGTPAFNGDGVNSINSQRIRIGGPSLAERNVIAANEGAGVFLQLATSSEVTIQNNFIGTNAAGMTSLGNQEIGVRAENSSDVLVIDNLLSGNSVFGIGATNINRLSVRGNRIGTDASGSTGIVTQVHGIEISNSSNVFIGGPDPSDGNLLSGNIQLGLRLLGTFNGLEVQNNRIGTNAEGNTAVPNGSGLSVSIAGSSDVLISENLVSGNTQTGILVFGDAESTARISRNFVGTNSAGDAVISNGRPNIHVIQASNVEVTNNVSAGSLASSGLIIDQSRNILASDNLLGVLADGVTEAENNAFGLFIQSSFDVNVSDNTISGNRLSGVRIQNSTFEPELVQWRIEDGGNGRWYWLTPDRRSWRFHNAAAVALGGHLTSVNTAEENAFLTDTFISNAGQAWIGLNDFENEGEFVWSNGDAFGFENFRSGEPNGGRRENFVHFEPDGTWNDNNGNVGLRGIVEFESEPDPAVLVAAYGNITLTGNNIGVGADGVTPVPNQDGFDISDSANVIIGGPEPVDTNIIAHNTNDGVHIRREANVTITGNSISANGREGIDLAPQGPTANDNLDADEGPNGLQNHPVIEDVAVSENSTTVTGSLHSQPDSTFEIEVFENAPTDSAAAQGEVFLGRATLSTDSNGDGQFTLTIPRAVNAAQLLTATATDSSGNTSEFSTEPLTVPSLTLTIDAASITEDGSALVTVTRNTSTSSALDVEIFARDEDFDFAEAATEIQIPASVVIPAGSRSTTFQINGIDDRRVDGTQTVIVFVEADGIDFSEAAAAFLDVTDINTASVIVDEGADGLVVDEGDALFDSYTIALTSIPSAPVTVFIQPDDELVTDPIEVIFAADESALVPQTVFVAAVDNFVVEETRTAAVRHVLTSDDAVYDGLLASDVIVTIRDDDAAEITITGRGTGSENDAMSGQFIITSSLAAAEDVTVTYTVGGTATAGDDFEALSGTVVIPAGQTSATIDLTVLDDGLPERVESVELTLQDASANGDVTISDENNAATINIISDDLIEIITSVSQVAVSEDGTNATVEVSLGAQPSSIVVVRLTSSDESESVVVPSTLIFTPENWNTPQIITISGVDDDDVDGSQFATITLSVSVTESASEYRFATDQLISVTNTDNDSIRLVPSIDSVVFFNQDANAERLLSPERNGQRSIIRRIEVTLSDAVNIDPAATTDGTFRLLNESTGEVVPLEIASQVQVNGRTVVTLEFGTSPSVDGSGSLVDGLYEFQIDGAAQGIDADGSGIAGGVSQISFHRLFGDSDGDRDVDNTDFGNLYRAFFGAPQYLAAFDRDDDDDLFDELAAFFANYGRII